MPTAPLLQRFVDDELGRSAAFVAKVLAGTLQLLRDSKDSGLPAGERGHCVELIAALQKQADLYQSTFIESLRVLVAEDLRGAAAELPADPKSTFGGLELMDESLVDVDIEISRAMQLIDTTAEWELRELQTFTSTLIGQSHVSAESNPFRPLIYATALWQAACAVATAQVQRATLLRLSAGVAAGLLKNAWAAACSRLETQGIEPGTYRTVVLAGGGSGAGGGRAASIDVTRPGALGGLLARMPGGAPAEGRLSEGDPPASGAAPAEMPGRGGTPGAAGRARPDAQSAEFEAALLRLDELLRLLPPAGPAATQPMESSARLGHHRSVLVASAGEAGDRQVIELLSRIFETILSDPRLPAAFRPIVARMQVAALRVALREPAMMDSHNHAVWFLMDRIGEASIAYSQADDPRLAALLAFCQSIAEEVARIPAPDSALFRRALNRLDGFLAEQFQAQLKAAQAAVAALELAERRGIVEQHLSQRLAEQMASVRTTPGIRRFVTGSWAKVLAEAMLRFGKDAEPTEAYLKTVDDLLWSLQIPDHPQSRQRLLAVLPVMLQRLRSGMELIGMQRPEQQAVLDELMLVHAEALRPGSRARLGRAEPPGDRAEDARGSGERCRRAEAVQRLGDRPVVDGHGPRRHARKRRRHDRRARKADREPARRRPDAALRPRPLGPVPAAVAQRPGPVLPVRRRQPDAQPFDHAACPRAPGRGRADRSASAEAAAAAGRRSPDARDLGTRLTATRRRALPSPAQADFSSCSICAATQSGRSCTIQCVAPGTRTSRSFGT